MKQISLDKYAAILHKPYLKSRQHPHMALGMRATQFAPFAALSGHEEAIKNICQYLEQQQKPAEYELEILKRQLDHLQEIINQKPLITICFVDEASPASTQRITAHVKRLDEYAKRIILEGGRKIAFGSIMSIDFND